MLKILGARSSEISDRLTRRPVAFISWFPRVWADVSMGARVIMRI